MTPKNIFKWLCCVPLQPLALSRATSILHWSIAIVCTDVCVWHCLCLSHSGNLHWTCLMWIANDILPQRGHWIGGNITKLLTRTTEFLRPLSILLGCLTFGSAPSSFADVQWAYAAVEASMLVSGALDEQWLSYALPESWLLEIGTWQLCNVSSSGGIRWRTTNELHCPYTQWWIWVSQDVPGHTLFSINLLI